VGSFRQQAGLCTCEPLHDDIFIESLGVAWRSWRLGGFLLNLPKPTALGGRSNSARIETVGPGSAGCMSLGGLQRAAPGPILLNTSKVLLTRPDLYAISLSLAVEILQCAVHAKKEVMRSV